ncbi:glycerate kinase [Neobacillus niacini]|uniref:glycerate kinase n=1 Tax=Neobacillus driksii TaxID=3035913 RepID=UPI002780C028|nr:glycerate kinase [Neobacillus niacini]MDQ0973820.1 glycerate kinase [Neobacillus niacini]
MKIIIAPDSFKESLTSIEVSQAIEEGMKSVLPSAKYVKIPMADGGEGTVSSLVNATEGKMISKVVTGPLGKPVESFFGILGDGKTAVIEMAAASGLGQVPNEKRNPLVTTTYGVGELIIEALNYRVEKIIIGLGGSATNDAGAGMLQALGVSFLTDEGTEIGFGGGELGKIRTIDISGLDRRLASVSIEVACDVDTPLVGSRGASAIFGPQKGATPDMVQLLDGNLAHFANCVQKTLGKDIRNLPGSGAAGGLGGGIIAFLPAELKSGVDIVIEATGLSDHMADADLVITGEGKIDHQTICGKTPIGVAKAAKKYNLPVIAIAGHLGSDSYVVKEYGIDALLSIVPGVVSLENALENAREYVERCAENIGTSISVGMGLKLEGNYKVSHMLLK